ncbi:hypothetical protein [Segniliparus rugosus]|uniref:Uncharacterized protein n=1 Tax=Segniliparus rugosus (strain ATCC BAA-974 / DSM 45345 / CCUG 50838 / CIP 108380 / JCM 13579 / CDC 945) TaxID=679197 RepID=E5XN79_SEGRC|nr:hypothetical protein [Segniliparus rugosus]EFV14175.1 hypothetical protein HMPREF9336_00949 [Segniliparus rugosus ATCC BAA-974]
MNNGADPGGRPGVLSIKDLDALRIAALQFREAGDTITGLQANTSISESVSGGLPGTDTEKGVANVDETLKGALQNQGQWLEDLSGKLLGALDQIAQVDHDAAAALAQEAPEQGGAPADAGGGASGGGSGSDRGGSGGGDSGGGSSGGGAPSGGGSASGGAPSGDSGSGAPSGSGEQGEGQPSEGEGLPGAQDAAQPVEDQTGDGDGDTMSIMGPDGREVKLSPEQTKNAKAIIEAGKQLGVSDGDVQSALQTALRESGLHNYGSTEYPESLQYADKKPDGSPWLSNDQSMIGLFPHEGGVHADVQTMMDPYAQAAQFFEQHSSGQRASAGGETAGAAADRAQIL